jgi:hypothetical protein
VTRKVYQADFGSQADQMVLSAAANPIHNGGFPVWQRGAGFTSMANGTYMADRWMYGAAGTTAVVDALQGALPAIAALVPGSNYSLALTTTTADVAIAAGDVISIQHTIEGYNWRPYTQQQFTVGFWVYATATGTYCVAARNSGLDRSCNIEYTVNASDTWEYKTVTFPASPSAGTWNYTNGAGLYLSWVLAAGSTYQATTGSWSTSSAVASAAQVNAVSTIGHDFVLWGVTMGLGTTVAPFWPRSFGEELALCQRYFWKSFPYGTAPAQASGATGYLTYRARIGGVAVEAVHLRFPVTMRATPTLTAYSIASANDKWRNLSDNADSGAGGFAHTGDGGSEVFNIQVAGDGVGEALGLHVTATADL